MEERIKQLRKTLGLNQTDFGEKIGISASGISKFEAGLTNPAESTIKLICATYHVKRLWLETGQGTMFEDDALARIDRLVEQYAPNADAVFKAQVKAYGALMSDEDWLIFRDIVEKVRGRQEGK